MALSFHMSLIVQKVFIKLHGLTWYSACFRSKNHALETKTRHDGQERRRIRVTACQSYGCTNYFRKYFLGSGTFT